MGLKARKVPGSCPSHLSVLHSAPAEGEASGNPCLVYAIDLQTFTKPPRWIIHPDCCSLSRSKPYLKWRTVTAYLTLLLQETEMAGFSGTFHHTRNSAAACHAGHKLILGYSAHQSLSTPTHQEGSLCSLCIQCPLLPGTLSPQVRQQLPLTCDRSPATGSDTAFPSFLSFLIFFF